jgi:hypothetical protein
MGATSTIRIARAAALGVATLIGGGVSAPIAQAAYTVTLLQEGSNVVATGSGTFDLAALPVVNPGPISFAAVMQPDIGFILTGPASAAPLRVNGFATGPTNFGSGGGQILASSGSGDLVGITGNIGTLALPESYVSGAALSDTSTYDNQTFASLGATPGTYVWHWGSGADADSFTLQIGAAAVPEPGSLTVLAMGLAGLGMVLRTRRA